jgi:hypothetical protein
MPCRIDREAGEIVNYLTLNIHIWLKVIHGKFSMFLNKLVGLKMALKLSCLTTAQGIFSAPKPRQIWLNL